MRTHARRSQEFQRSSEFQPRWKSSPKNTTRLKIQRIDGKRDRDRTQACVEEWTAVRGGGLNSRLLLQDSLKPRVRSTVLRVVFSIV